MYWKQGLDEKLSAQLYLLNVDQCHMKEYNVLFFKAAFK